MMPEQDNVYLSAKPCDSCKASPAILFCRSHSVFLCASCDANIHASSTDKHERVWLCEVCEQSPADVTCKADSAALCSSCDLHIHSANALASRHERLPVLPFFGTDFLPSDYFLFLDFGSPVDISDIKHQTKSISYLDSSVPTQTNSINCSGRESCFEIDFSHSNSSQCISQSVSSSEAGVVSDGSSNSISEVSNFPFLNSLSAQPLQISGIDRKARVMRYREKKKNRKFQKTIRYASRKAYAERRPRIKGRFTKRIDDEGEVNRIYSVAGLGGFFTVNQAH